MGIVASLGLWLWAVAGLVSAQTPPNELVNALRHGGLVVIVEHTSATLDQPHWPEPQQAANPDCRQQAQLSPDGRRQAGWIGRALRALKVPIGRVLASPHCRSRHTAFLAFGADRVRYSPLLASGCPNQAEDAIAVNDLLAEPPVPGTNTILITHRCALQHMAAQALARCGMPPEPGGALVIEPQANNWQPLGCISLAQWRQWSKLPYPARPVKPVMG